MQTTYHLPTSLPLSYWLAAHLPACCPPYWAALLTPSTNMASKSEFAAAYYFFLNYEGRILEDAWNINDAKRHCRYRKESTECKARTRGETAYESNVS